MATIESKIIDAAARREQVRHAEADEIGRIIQDALNTSNPLELSKLKAELSSIDPSASLDALIVVAEFVKDAKPADFAKAAKALADAEKKLSDKQADKQMLIEKLDAEIDTLTDQRDEARSANAMADVSRKRYEALKTGTPDPGYGAYAQPELRSWAKRAKLI